MTAGIENKTYVQVRKSKRNANIRARLLRCISGDHVDYSFFLVLATTAKSLFISLQTTVAPWLELSGSAGVPGVRF